MDIDIQKHWNAYVSRDSIRRCGMMERKVRRQAFFAAAEAIRDAMNAVEVAKLELLEVQRTPDRFENQLTLTLVENTSDQD